MIIQERADYLAEAIHRKIGNMVYDGPFKWMKLPAMSGSYAPWLLGTYEHELHGIIYNSMSSNYKSILNVGCGFGYYAVGLARALPDATVWATDLDNKMLDVCAEMSELNGCNNICLSNASRPINLSNNDLIIMDCEGAEIDYLQPQQYDFNKTDILVECHECFASGITQVIIDRFNNTHNIEVIHNKPASFDLERIFGPDLYVEHLDPLIVTWEGRSGPTPWLWCVHK